MGARFEINASSQPVAAVMARAWVHRMQHFYDLELQSGTEGAQFSLADIASYQEPSEFQRVALSLATHPLGAQRVVQIRRLFT